MKNLMLGKHNVFVKIISLEIVVLDNVMSALKDMGLVLILQLLFLVKDKIENQLKMIVYALKISMKMLAL